MVRYLENGTTFTGKFILFISTQSYANYNISINKQLPWICSHEQSFEFPYSTYVYPTTYSLPLVKCPIGWIPYHTACYKLVFEHQDFESARDKCQRETIDDAVRTDIMTIWDDYELKLAISMFRSDNLPNREPEDLSSGLWIGLEFRIECKRILMKK